MSLRPETSGTDPTVNPAAASAAAEVVQSPHSAGQMIGRYRLLEVIGEGGFGTVWLAEQREPVERRVALKIIKLGMDTREVIARFEAERQALAMMDHPNIAHVLDAGATESGRPYFVMELVRGLPITEYCDRHRLTTRQRLDLFTTVCSAVQHAHQKGIIHRDLKPSNVMVSLHDGRAVPKVIDFGIAKATHQRLTEKTLFTSQAHFVGTPQYMSPEQAEMTLDVDTRTDIYSLGVLLYELLTGSAPFEPERLRSAAYAEIQRIIREEDPPRPSTRLSLAADPQTIARQHGAEPRKLLSMLRGDLDWIVLKAMEKDRSRRYDSAGAFGEDVVRHLRSEPVIAGPPGARYRMGKFVRRHRLGVAAGVLIGVSVLAGSLLATAGFVRAHRALEREQAAHAQAEERRIAAERQTRIAQEVNRFLNEDLLRAADPYQRGREVTVLDVLQAASMAVGARFTDEPAVEAAIRATLGRTYQNLGELETAERHLARAVQLHRAEYGPDHVETLRSLKWLALLYWALDRKVEAEPVFLDVLSHRDEDPEALSSLWIPAMTSLAGMYREQWRFEEAAALYEEAMELAAVLPGDDAARLSVLEGMGGMHRDEGRFAEAEPLYLEVAEAYRRRHGEVHPMTLGVLNNLAVVYRQSGKLEEAEPIYIEVYEAQRQVLTDRHPRTIASRTNLGRLYQDMGRYDEAIGLYEEVLPLSREVLGESHRGTLITMAGLSASYSRSGRHAEAAEVGEQALRLSEGGAGDPMQSAMLRQGLANTYMRWERHGEAETHALAALEVVRGLLPEGHWFIGMFLNTLGQALTGLARFEEAESILNEAYAVLMAALGPESAETAAAADSLARLYEAWSKPEQAAQWAKIAGRETAASEPE